MKKTRWWKKPKLTVLVRDNPEEAVLQTCKASDIPSGPGSTNGGCYAPGCPFSCGGFAAS